MKGFHVKSSFLCYNYVFLMRRSYEAVKGLSVIVCHFSKAITKWIEVWYVQWFMPIELDLSDRFSVIISSTVILVWRNDLWQDHIVDGTIIIMKSNRFQGTVILRCVRRHQGKIKEYTMRQIWYPTRDNFQILMITILFIEQEVEQVH